MRDDGEMFGAERLAALVAREPAGPDAFIDAAFAAASTFRGRNGAPFDDDCTMVILELAGARSVRQSEA
jgi:serine phosphatase RsbU (regulator of sigma subunit)